LLPKTPKPHFSTSKIFQDDFQFKILIKIKNHSDLSN